MSRAHPPAIEPKVLFALSDALSNYAQTLPASFHGISDAGIARQILAGISVALWKVGDDMARLPPPPERADG